LRIPFPKTELMVAGVSANVQAIIGWLPTAKFKVEAWVKSCWIYVGNSNTGARFIRLFRFPFSNQSIDCSTHRFIRRLVQWAK
jgi:hypothetical protein